MFMSIMITETYIKLCIIMFVVVLYQVLYQHICGPVFNYMASSMHDIQNQGKPTKETFPPCIYMYM